jgi:hypothetical protein
MLSVAALCWLRERTQPSACLSGARSVAKGSARADPKAVWGSGSVLVWVGEVQGYAQRQGKGWGSVGARSRVFRAAAGGEPRVCEPNSVAPNVLRRSGL